jgi:hypothetical protein
MATGYRATNGQDLEDIFAKKGQELAEQFGAGYVLGQGNGFRKVTSTYSDCGDYSSTDAALQVDKYGKLKALVNVTHRYNCRCDCWDGDSSDTDNDGF